jgi:hypothetical protein
MNLAVQPYHRPGAAPVGQSGSRVDIGEPRVSDQWLGRRGDRRRLHRRCCRRHPAGQRPSGGGHRADPGGVVILFRWSSCNPAGPGWCGSSSATPATPARYVAPACGGSCRWPTRRNVSSRVRNFETNHLKVNDADGNPVEIVAIVVGQVAGTPRGVYAVDYYLNFVHAQAESALGQIATTHPYNDPIGAVTSLRGSTDVVADELAQEVGQRVVIAGVEIVDHLAYASEIALAMLRFQQAKAVVATRARIVEGAVGTVEAPSTDRPRATSSSSTRSPRRPG